MQKPGLHQILGYAGALPFLIGAGALLFIKEPSLIAGAAMVQIVYAGLILSFLSGVQWAHALPKKNTVLMVISMLPSIVSLLLIIFALLSYNFMVPLFVFSLAFAAMYFVDSKFLERDWLPGGYFCFRRHLSALVFACLFFSAVTFWI